MRRFPIIPAGIVLLLALFALETYGNTAQENWPTWRGPNATGAAPNANPPLSWSETENIKWKVKYPGEGTSSPVIWGDKIFFQTAIQMEQKSASTSEPNSPPADQAAKNQNTESKYQFDLVCLDRKSGGILWQRTACEAVPHEGHHPDGSFASFSPVTDGKKVWINFGSRGVHCYDVEGRHQWSRDLGIMKIHNAFGESSSPALAGEALVVVMDSQENSRMYALHKDTGEILWEKKRDEPTSWSTPVATEVDGKIQVIVNAVQRVRSYDLTTGEVIWECGGQTRNVIPSPVVGFGMVFCTSGFRGSMLQGIELGHTGDLTGTAAVLWEIDKYAPYVPSPVLYGEKIYVCWGNKANVSCYEARTGRMIFEKQPLEGLDEIYASPVGAADRIYFVGRDGKTAVIRYGDTLELLAVNTLDDKIDASPALVGDEIFLKGKNYIYCIGKG